MDAQGGTLLPGFIDAHTHLQFSGQAVTAVDVSGAHSAEAVLSIIEAAANRLDDDAWVEVIGYHQHRLGRHLTAPELHRAGGGRRVWVRHISSHASVVSTAVIEAITDPAARADENVQAGLLVEGHQELVRLQRLPYSTDEIAGLVKHAATAAREDGVTFCTEAGIGGFLALSTLDLRAYVQLQRRGELPVRLELMPSFDTFHPVDAHPSEGFHRGHDLGLITGLGAGSLIQIGAQKVMLDGGMMVRAARMTEPYVDSRNTGSWQRDPAELREAILDGHAAGWQLAVHAIGDAAVDFALDCFDQALAQHPRKHRHRIEHGGAIRPDQIPRLASLALTVVTQPAFIHDSVHDFAEILGTHRADWLYRGRSLLDGGIRLVGSTDRPLPGTPLSAIQAFVDRTNVTGRRYAPQEAVTVHEAIEMFTVHGAWIAGLEDVLGRLRPGFFADLCLLERDPWTVPTEEISTIPVTATAVGGELRWNR